MTSHRSFKAGFWITKPRISEWAISWLASTKPGGPFPSWTHFSFTNCCHFLETKWEIDAWTTLRWGVFLSPPCSESEALLTTRRMDLSESCFQGPSFSLSLSLCRGEGGDRELRWPLGSSGANWLPPQRGASRSSDALSHLWSVSLSQWASIGLSLSLVLSSLLSVGFSLFSPSLLLLSQSCFSFSSGKQVSILFFLLPRIKCWWTKLHTSLALLLQPERGRKEWSVTLKSQVMGLLKIYKCLKVVLSCSTGTTGAATHWACTLQAECHVLKSQYLQLKRVSIRKITSCP